MSVLARAQITIIVINDGPTGPTGKRMLTGMVHYQLSNASAPAKPSATAFNFSTRVFSGLTANWAIDSPVYASGNANKYWYCPYTVEESTSGSGTGTPVFGTVKQAIGFSGLVTFTGDQSVSDGTKTLSFGAAGTTKIDGGNIDTGTVSADRIDVDNLVAKQVVIGKIQDVAGPLATTAKNDAISAAASDATTKASDAENAAKAYADTQLGNFATTVTGSLSDLQNQIDGNITTWFYAYVPTTANAPASGWTTTALKNQHLGDLFYNTATGFCYRYQLVSSVYSWQRITDSDVTKALADAAAAQDTADSKRRVFVATPVTPYDIGDLWLKSGDLYKCKVTRATGSYVASDWEKGVKYTDDTVANANLVTAKAYADTKKAEAIAAAEAAAEAEALAAQTAAEAHADGIVTAEEQARIADVNAKLAAAQSYAETKASEAQTAAQQYAATAASNAQSAAQSYALAKANLAETTAKAYADGIVTAEETRAIADATAKANAAKAAAEATAAALDAAIQVGGRNLLKDTKAEVRTTRYLMKNYYLGSVKPQEGEQVTIMFRGALGTGKSYFGLYNSGASVNMAVSIKNTDKGADGIYRKTFNWKILTASNTYLSLYHMLSSVTAESWVAEMMLVIGNKVAYYSEAPEDIQAEIDAADAAAAAAQSTANAASAAAAAAQSTANAASTAATNAQTSANTANNLLSDIANDNKFTPLEKQETKKEWDAIVSEKTKNDSQADTFGVSKTAYGTAYTALSNYITPLLSNLTTTSNITGTTFRSTFKAYYDARTDLLNAIAAKARTLANTAQTTANNAATAAAAAVTTAASDATSKMNAAKDALAVRLGYTNYAAMAAEAAATGKLIVGGLLNANIIDVQTLVGLEAFLTRLVARNISTTPNAEGWFVRIDDDDPTVFEVRRLVNGVIDENNYIKFGIFGTLSSSMPQLLIKWNGKSMFITSEGLSVRTPDMPSEVVNPLLITMKDYIVMPKLALSSVAADYSSSYPIMVWRDSKGYLKIGNTGNYTAADVGALPSNTIQYFTQAQWNALTQAQKDAVPLALVEET